MASPPPSIKSQSSKPTPKLSPKPPTITDSSPSIQGLLEVLQSPDSMPSRRLRPDHLQSSSDELRVPLKPAKISRRESRLGLRNIFGRSKSKDSHISSTSTSTSTSSSSKTKLATASAAAKPLRQVVSKPSGLLRSSFVDFSAWQSPLSPKTTLTATTTSPPPTATTVCEPSLQPIDEAESQLNIPSRRNRTKKKPSIVVDVHAANQITQKTRQPPLHPSHEPVTESLSPPASVPIPRLPSQSQMYKTTKAPMATWNPPPLFRAYPQAIRHSRLPASNVSADSLLRAQEKRTGNSAAKGIDASGSSKASETSTASLNSAEFPPPKKKGHRRIASSSLPKIEWTHKIYVLVTSGYLLQYSGAGAYDRLPEKILHLGKESAAFVTDIFPGKHWVLQVSALMDSQGTMSAGTRSIFSRLLEKRHASNYLMVFERSDDMDGWIGVLRREIEALGGKKMLSETGEAAPKAEPRRLRAQGSQRTLVVRDPARFSKALPAAPDQLSVLSWNTRSNRNSNSHHSFVSHSQSNRNSNSHSISQHSYTQAQSNRNSTISDVDVPPPPPTASTLRCPKDKDLEREKEADDEVSTINSAVSHDGRQLDNLREYNRLSIVSSLLSSVSGQRTVLTSAASSPACSPIRDSFLAHVEDAATVVTSRQAIPMMTLAEKRQSMQSFNSLSTGPGTNISRPRSSMSLAIDPAKSRISRGSLELLSPSTPTLTVPNFSVPNPAMRRFSVARSPSADTLSFKDAVRTSSVRKLPLPALRHLPTVHDLPSSSSCLRSTTPTTANSLRPPSHISECFAVVSPVPESPTASTASPATPITIVAHGQGVPSRRSSRAVTEHGSRRPTSIASPSPLPSPVPSPSYYVSNVHAPRRHHSTRITRTSSFNVGSSIRHSVISPTTQTIVVPNRPHIAELASLPLPSTPRAPRPQSSRLRDAPPVSLDTITNSPRKVGSAEPPSTAPTFGADSERRRSLVLEPSEVVSHNVHTTARHNSLSTGLLRRASVQAESVYHGRSQTGFGPPRHQARLADLAETPRPKTKPPLTVLLPKKAYKQGAIPDIVCSPSCDFPVTPIIEPAMESAPLQQAANSAVAGAQATDAKNTAAILNRRSMPIITSPPPAPPPTRALPPLPVNR
ncbi:translation initiation factor eIF3 subunit g [Ceratocystis pirilliformis]|uniref:Translation initiation factor eIF3 subunit g n=1 Tax=Ceratocystis pirilliformis TaxID=259994 RepID=A0ABR3Z701_9PEZI